MESSFSSWEKRKSASGEMRALDRSAAVELPVGQAEDDDVGEPDPDCGQQETLAVTRLARHEGMDQQCEREQVGCADHAHQGEGRGP